MLDTVLLEIFKFVGFLAITGGMLFLAYSLWWGTFIKSRRGKILIKFFVAHRELYINWLEKTEEYGELNKIMDGLKEEE